MIEITDKISIRKRDLMLGFSRSSGPGGQNVNKISSRVTVRLDVVNCASFSEGQKKRILTRLATRADKKGVIRVVSQRYRTQNANRNAAIERLVELLRGALKKKTVRKKTATPYRAKMRRLEEKKRHSMLKEQRRKIEFE